MYTEIESLKTAIEILQDQLEKLQEPEQPEVFNYPLVMVSNNGLIVKFIGLTTGILLYSDADDWEKGTYSSDWTPHTNKRTWKELPTYDSGLYYSQAVLCSDTEEENPTVGLYLGEDTEDCWNYVVPINHAFEWVTISREILLKEYFASMKENIS
jgi:hypothetical protein